MLTWPGAGGAGLCEAGRGITSSVAREWVVNQLGDKPEEVRKRLEEERSQKGPSRPGGEETGDAAQRTKESGEPDVSDEEPPENEDQNPL